MTIDMSQFYQVFFDETAEHLDEMEHLLLGLDVESPNQDDLNAIFRAAHSIKGGSGTFGFGDMTEVTHILESLLDRLRKGELAMRSDMVDAFLRAGDVLRGQLAGHRDGADVDPAAATEICATLKDLASDVHDAPAAPPTAPAAESPAPAEHLYHIEFSPGQKTEAQLAEFDPLFANLRAVGTLEVLESPPKGKKAADGMWRMTLRTTETEAAVADLFAFHAQSDQIKITAEPADPGYGFFDEPPAQEGSDPGYGFFDAVPAPAAEAEQGYGFFEPLPAPTATEPPPPPPAPTSPPDLQHDRRATDAPGGRRATDRAPATSGETASIRVGVDKVDQLINLVGELVITQAMLAQTATQVDPVVYEKLINGLAQLERNTRDLQESVMSIRMMPISFVFSRFPRVVRDLAAKLDKKVELVTVGENTELDKGLIEKIADPLTHLVRNSLDHGIESPEQRLAAGKPEHGTITLQAAHQGGNIVISVSDDGAGLNRAKILDKAREKGMPVHDGMSDNEVWQLILAPGFSTAEIVTDVSGRGVGMDVVKKNVLAMNGQLDLESSPGWGSRVTIRLPLTLAILDGMSIAVGGQIFIIPLTFITESLQPASADVKTVAGSGRVVHVRGEYLPLVTLYEVFGIVPRHTEVERGITVLIESEGKKAALFVDELVGQHQVVIKSLESNYRKVPGVSAATIMGDGTVALILDIAALVRISQQ